MKCQHSFYCVLTAFVLGILWECHGLVPLSTVVRNNFILPPSTTMILHMDSSDTNTGIAEEDNSSDATLSSSTTTAKLSLQEKMKGWEATEEEIKAATLGGVVPKRSDAFDIGLYIAFPLMVLSGLAFALFPFIMGSLDVDAVGPPPTV